MIPLRNDQPTFSTPFINYFLIVVNVVVFLWEFSVGLQSQQTLNLFLSALGIVPHHTVAVLTGQAYDGLATAILPLFTSMFLHASCLHVAGNMLFLSIFGDNIEDYLGHFRYLMFYLVSGVVAGTTQILLNQASPVPSGGAGGAIATLIVPSFILHPRARLPLRFPPIFLSHVPASLILASWFLGTFLSGF